MTFHPRAEWATRAPSFGDLHLPVRRVFAHHTAGGYMPGFDVGAMRALEEAEIGRGGYVALAYHELYTGDGDAIEARPLSKMGGATINNNSTSVAICLPGDYSTPGLPVVSFAQVGTAVERLVAMVVFGVITRDFELHPHRDVFATACPGHFADHLGGIRSTVEARLAGGVVVPPVTPPTHPPGDANAFLAHLAAAVTETRRFLVMGAVIALGAHNDAAWSVQIACNLDGAAAPPLVTDGRFGPATLAAVRQYQANHGLAVDGIVGRATYAAMFPA